jgi:hypothetical protein
MGRAQNRQVVAGNIRRAAVLGSRGRAELAPYRESMSTGIADATSRFEAVFGAGRGSNHEQPDFVTVTNDRGRAFTFRVVAAGGSYGRDRCVTTDHPLVEVYDATYAGDPDFEPEGQIISQYYLTTLAGHVGGLDLHGGVDAWKVDAQAMAEVTEFLAHA